VDVNPRLLSGVTALVRAELEEQTAAGFPKLKRIPSAGIIRFLDYWDSLPSREHASPMDTLAGLGALHFFPPFITKMHEELRTMNAACLRMYAAMKIASICVRAAIRRAAHVQKGSE
jgi:hypothetical protein